MPAVPILTATAGVSARSRGIRPRTRPFSRYYLLEGAPLARSWALLGNADDFNNAALRADRADLASPGPNELDLQHKRTRPAAQTNSTSSTNELGPRHKRTRPPAQTNSASAQTNSARGTNELDLQHKRTRPRPKRTRPAAQTNSTRGTNELGPWNRTGSAPDSIWTFGGFASIVPPSMSDAHQTRRPIATAFAASNRRKGTGLLSPAGSGRIARRRCRGQPEFDTRKRECDRGITLS